MTEDEKKKIETMAGMAGDTYPFREDIPPEYWGKPLVDIYPEYWGKEPKNGNTTSTEE